METGPCACSLAVAAGRQNDVFTLQAIGKTVALVYNAVSAWTKWFVRQNTYLFDEL